MKEAFLIIAVTMLGAVVGTYIRDNGTFAASVDRQAEPSITESELRIAEQALRSSLAPPREKVRVETETRSDGSSVVTYYKDDGSRGMRITYGPDRPGSATPRGSYIPSPAQPSAAPASRGAPMGKC